MEFRAIEVWGSQEALNRERMKAAEELKRYQQCTLLISTFVPKL